MRQILYHDPLLLFLQIFLKIEYCPLIMLLSSDLSSMLNLYSEYKFSYFIYSMHNYVY